MRLMNVCNPHRFLYPDDPWVSCGLPSPGQCPIPSCETTTKPVSEDFIVHISHLCVACILDRMCAHVRIACTVKVFAFTTCIHRSSQSTGQALRL